MIDRQLKDNNVTQEMIDEFLANGGTVTVCPPGERSEEIEFTGGFYAKRKKKKEEESDDE